MGARMARIKTILALLAVSVASAFAQSTPPQTSSQSAPAPKVRVSTAVMLGLVEHKTMPVYPTEAMKKGIQGDVIFNIEVDETGKLTSSVLVSGDPLLVPASKDSLRTFQFH